MNSKFIKFEKSPLLNPVDYYNFFGSFIGIFEGNKKFYVINENEVSVLTGDSAELKKPAFKKLDNNLIAVLKSNPLDIATGSEITKFMLLTAVKFKGDYFAAMSYVSFNIMKKDIPYIRVGSDYYKLINKTDRYGAKNTLLKHWKKDEIKEDHTKELLKLIYKFDDFTLLPNNIDFVPVIDSCYNLYNKFAHSPSDNLIHENDIPISLGLMNHIFGDQVNLGLKYMKILYEHPTQILPILSLVSNERGTGKTTFLNWIHMLFGENSVLINPHDLTSSFNSIYATKNIIMVDETVIEKLASVEKLKSIATAKSISVSQKFVSEYSIPFFGKVILCTNKEKDFMRIDEEEVRFWIRKIKPIQILNTSIENDLFIEVSKFLKYLLQMPCIDFTLSRMVFTMDEIKTEHLEHIKKESRSSLYKELEILIEDFFNSTGKNEFFATATDIKNEWFKNNNQIGISYIRKVIKEELKLQPEKLQKYYSFGDITVKMETGTPFKFINIYEKIQNNDFEQVNECPF